VLHILPEAHNLIISEFAPGSKLNRFPLSFLIVLVSFSFILYLEKVKSPKAIPEINIHHFAEPQ